MPIVIVRKHGTIAWTISYGRGLTMLDCNYIVKHREEILAWLFPVDFESRHIDIQAERRRGTGEWLLKATEFLSWKSAQKCSPFLWGSGIRELHARAGL
jgi:hypothetical protein